MPDPAELAEALERSRAWLAGTGAEGAVPLKQTLQGVLGAWACEQALASEPASSELGDLVEVARVKLERAVASGSFDPYAYDPKLLLLCLHVFGRTGAEPRVLRAFADSIAEGLEALPRVPAQHAGVAAILSEVGYRGLDRSADEEPTEPDLDALVRGGPDSVRAACGAVAAAAHFGARRVAASRFGALREVLPVILLQSLRSYDLDTAAVLVRTSRYLRMRQSSRLGEAIAFLLDQQKPDGRFGYFGVETSALIESGEIEGFDELLSVYLPITATCAWAVTEVLSTGCVLRRPARARARSKLRVLSSTT
jgi:hypothetical protein